MLAKHFIAFSHNNTGAQMLDSIHHMTLKLFKNRISGVKTSKFCHNLDNVRRDYVTLRNL